MESDIKQEFEKINNRLDEFKRINFADIKQKFEDMNIREIRETLKIIKEKLERLDGVKDKLESIENKIQK